MLLIELENKCRKFVPISKIIDTILNDAGVQRFIVNAITERLYLLGETSTGKQLKTDNAIQKRSRFKYTNYTVQLKQSKGQPTDRVTLNDTGKFYRSFKVKTGKNSIVISANMTKKDGEISENFELSFSKSDFTKEILSLNNEEKSKFVRNILIPKIIEQWQKI